MIIYEKEEGLVSCHKKNLALVAEVGRLGQRLGSP